MTRREIAIRRAAEIAAVNAYYDALLAALETRTTVRHPAPIANDSVSDLDRAEAERIMRRRGIR